ncbi:MAG TPA: SGNH/GDSL hydrolase family protein [Caulobacteraceae bacterium]|nr:SGNH/GDSL hydrolase family protein [Caulobacteraceae bacterium]
MAVTATGAAHAARPKPAKPSEAAAVWAATWESSPEPARPPIPDLAGQTVRQIAHVSLGGIYIRAKLSNTFGDKPLVIGAAHIALASGAGAAIQPATDHALTFSGRPGITIPIGASVISDPVFLTVPAFSNVVVSVYFPVPTGTVTENYFSMQTSYMAAGDQTAAPDMPGAATMTQRVVLTGLDVSAGAGTKVVVALGDSLTGGFGSTLDANHRWTDLLALRLADRRDGPPIGVVNAGIGGNRLLHDFFGPNGLARFDRDVLDQPSVGYLIVLLGINDFGLPGGHPELADEDVSADDVIAGYRQLIQRANSFGIKVFIATIPPFGPLPQRPGYYSDAAEAKREAVNAWIRTNRDAQGYVDFDAALQDPKVRIRMLAAYDSADHLDPNDAGYQVMANAVDMRLFEP